MKIGFVWQGSSDDAVFAHWNDGLREAMRVIEQKHTVFYYEPWDDITDVDVILYWEAPCTVNGPNSLHYQKVQNNGAKKALLFAGGPLEKEWVLGFDLLFIESEINEKECDELGIPYVRAFGINDRVFTPEKQPKVFDGIHHGTCASWKRQWLVAKALEDKALICGRYQQEDPRAFDESREHGALVLGEMRQGPLNSLLNASWSMVQTSDYWGGGQRATLEAMSAGVPIICMEDSPKNREFVEESGAGIVVRPDYRAIQDAVEEIKGWTEEQRLRGHEYVQSKWTAKQYADTILTTIESL